MHLDQLIHTLQRPGGIDPMGAAGKEVVFINKQGKPLLIGLFEYRQDADKIYLGLQAASEAAGIAPPTP